jgi:hypothetical protein
MRHFRSGYCNAPDLVKRRRDGRDCDCLPRFFHVPCRLLFLRRRFLPEWTVSSIGLCWSVLAFSPSYPSSPGLHRQRQIGTLKECQDHLGTGSIHKYSISLNAIPYSPSQGAFTHRNWQINNLPDSAGRHSTARGMLGTSARRTVRQDLGGLQNAPGATSPRCLGHSRETCPGYFVFLGSPEYGGEARAI